MSFKITKLYSNKNGRLFNQDNEDVTKQILGGVPERIINSESHESKDSDLLKSVVNWEQVTDLTGESIDATFFVYSKNNEDWNLEGNGTGTKIILSKVGDGESFSYNVN